MGPTTEIKMFYHGTFSTGQTRAPVGSGWVFEVKGPKAHRSDPHPTLMNALSKLEYHLLMTP